MDLKMIIDISLTDDEVSFLRRYFENREGSLNLFFNSQTSLTLLQKGGLMVDYLQNASLTTIGKKVVDMIDGDKRIDEILN